MEIWCIRRSAGDHRARRAGAGRAGGTSAGTAYVFISERRLCRSSADHPRRRRLYAPRPFGRTRYSERLGRRNPGGHARRRAFYRGNVAGGGGIRRADRVFRRFDRPARAAAGARACRTLCAEDPARHGGAGGILRGAGNGVFRRRHDVFGSAVRRVEPSAGKPLLWLSGNGCGHGVSVVLQCARKPHQCLDERSACRDGCGNAGSTLRRRGIQSVRARRGQPRVFFARRGRLGA